MIDEKEIEYKINELSESMTNENLSQLILSLSNCNFGSNELWQFLSL